MSSATSGPRWKSAASGLAALYCGHELNFLPTEEYDRRMRRALQTL